LFDLDDTILDDRGGLDAVRRTISEEAARHTPGIQASELLASMVQVQTWFWSDPERHRVGRRDLRATTTMLLAEALSRVGVVDPGLAAVLGQRYRDLRESSTRPFAGAVETLAFLAKSDVRLALITNGAGPSQRAKVVRHDLARYFDHILIEGEFGVGKPDSTVYLTAMTALGSAPSSTWVVGDNLEWEVAAPQRLGFTGIWVDAAREGLPNGSLVKPDRIIHSVSELGEQAAGNGRM
jgi:putative hydrolase of the HAD superfamily